MISAIILIVLIIVIALFISQKIQLNKITEQIKNEETIRVSLNNSSIEKLASAINEKNSFYKKEQIKISNREEKLKESIANVSHDLRTPLTAIQGYLTLLEEGSIEERKRYLEVIKLKACSLENLINSFYEVSILDDDKFIIDKTSVDINSVVTEAIISNYALFNEKGIVPSVVIPNEKLLILGEQIACERIIQNLITNAIKYSTGEIEIGIKKEKKETIFLITNGIKDREQIDEDSLFDKFYTVDKSRNSKSTGLGLFIVKILLTKIEGRIVDVSIKNNRIKIKIGFKNY